MAGITPNYPAHNGLAPDLSRFVDVEGMEWTEFAPGMRLKCLYKDDAKKESVYLFWAQPGAMIPEHIHTGAEFTFVLEGSMEDADGNCTAGNFVWRPYHSKHTVQLPYGAKFLTFFQGSAQRTATGNLFPSYETAPAATKAAE